jgi:tetratricopeptide (TPR) repeat protein
MLYNHKIEFKSLSHHLGGRMNISARNSLLATVLLSCFLVFATTANAQIRSIKGKVVDDKDQPVADAAIKFQGQDIFREVTAKTNKKGEYTYLLGIQGGIFRIIVRAPGFQPAVRENVRPEVGETKEENFKLTPGKDYKLPSEMTEAEKKEFEKEAETQKQRKEMSDSVRANLTAAQQLIAGAKYDEAIVELNKALEKYPKEAFLHAAVAEAYTKLGKNEDALASYQKAIEADPKNSEYMANLGVIQNAMGKTAEAQESFKQAAAINPAAAAKNFYNLGVTLINSGKTQVAVDAFKKSIEADPNYSESYFQLGIALSGSADSIPAAIENFKKYKSLGKGKPENLAVVDDLIKALGGK